jgi:macrolide-specific efflux system membrane fusion protein
MAYMTLLATTLLLGSATLSCAQGTSAEPQDYECHIFYIDQPVLAAGESGILTEILVEGTEVKQGQEIAATDDADAMLRRQGAWYAWQAIVKDLESEIRREYAVANFEAAKAAYRQVVEANLRSPKAVSQAELDRRELEMKAARLSIKNEEHQRSVSEISVHKEEAEFKLASAIAMRHKIRSPIDGVVAERMKEIGEFVQAGEEVVKIVRLDRLRAVGHIPLQLMTPSQAKGRSVNITVDVGNQPYQVSGTIYHSDTTITAANQFDVWVEFQNPEGFPIRPGMIGRMTIN